MVRRSTLFSVAVAMPTFDRAFCAFREHPYALALSCSCNAFHHKGQIVAMCRALGHPAHDTDLNQFE